MVARQWPQRCQQARVRQVRARFSAWQQGGRRDGHIGGALVAQLAPVQFGFKLRFSIRAAEEIMPAGGGRRCRFAQYKAAAIQGAAHTDAGIIGCAANENLLVRRVLAQLAVKHGC